MMQNLLVILVAIAAVGLLGVYFLDGIWDRIFGPPAAISIVILAVWAGFRVAANRR